MLTRSPTVLSPTYARWFAFASAPKLLFLTSTKLPIWARGPSSAPGEDARTARRRGIRAHAGPLEVAVGGDFSTVANHDIPQNAVRPNPDSIAQADLTFKDTADVDTHIATHTQIATHVDAGRIEQLDAALHQDIG
jgi:hypothetical protein